MNYQEAIEEFDKLDDEDLQFKEIYAHFGIAVFNAQLLEQQAINMIVIARHSRKKSLTKQEVDLLWTSYDYGNKTLGNLINELRQLYQFTDNDFIEFKELLKIRNYITHDYFRHNSGIWYSRGGLKRIIKDLYDFIDRRVLFDIKLGAYLKTYSLSIGLTDEIMEKVYKEMMESWKNEEIDDTTKTFHKS